MLEVRPHPQERERRLPRCDVANWSGDEKCLAVNERNRANATAIMELSSALRRCSLSPGERVRVRAIVKRRRPPVIRRGVLKARPHPGPMTRSRPLARSAADLRLRQIPFGGSQPPQVPPGEGETFAAIRRCEPSW